MGEEKPSAEIYPPAGACSGRVYRAIRLVLPPDSFGGVAQAAAITCRRLLWFVHCPLPGAAHLYRSIPPSHRCLDNSYVGHELRDLSAQEKWSGYTIVRLGFPLIATDRTSVEPGKAFPNVFPANRMGHHENSLVLMDRRKISFPGIRAPANICLAERVCCLSSVNIACRTFEFTSRGINVAFVFIFFICLVKYTI